MNDTDNATNTHVDEMTLLLYVERQFDRAACAGSVSATRRPATGASLFFAPSIANPVCSLAPCSNRTSRFRPAWRNFKPRSENPCSGFGAWSSAWLCLESICSIRLYRDLGATVRTSRL